MADKIVTDKGTISLDIVDEIIKSNELRSSGEDYGYYYDKKTNRLEIGDVNAVTSNMYIDLNEQIQQGGVDTTEELKGLAGKATGIDVPPSGDIPIVTDLTGIRMPSKEKMASNVTSFLTKLGVPMDNSMFVGELLTDVNQSGMGILDATGIGELSELAEGFTKFQSGLASDDPKLALGGLAQTTLGAVGAYPFFKTLFDKASPKAKEALSGLATKAREYKSSQTPGTKLLSTDPTDPAVDAIIKLDELVNKPQGPELTGPSGELGFYSKALEETKKLQQKKGTGQQFRQMLKKAGVSDDEIEWSGLNIVLSKDKTTKKEIEDQLRLNKLEIREVVKDKLPEETQMSWEEPYRSSFVTDYETNKMYNLKSPNELKEGELPESQSANILPKNLMTPEEVFGPNYIDNRADELLDENSITGVTVNSNYTIEQARADALREFYDDPFIRIEDQNTGIVILGNDSTGYSIYPDMQSTKGEGAYKNAFKTLDYMRNPIPSLSEAKVQAQDIAIDKGLMSFGDEGMVRFSDDSYRLAGGENYREFVITSDRYDSFVGGPFRSDHFDESNVIGHFRTSDRTTLAGDKVLYIDEIQSDWGQKGREKGFKKSEEEMEEISQKRKDAQALVDKYTEQVKQTGKDLEGKELDEANQASNFLSKTQEFVLDNDRKIVKGPFVENTPKWTDLMVKRILAKAVEEGYDMVSFSPGYIQNMRWREPGLIKYYDDILVKRVTKIVDKLDDTAYGAGSEEIGQLNKNRGSKGFGRINLDDTDFDEIEERALKDTAKRSGEGKFFDFTKEQVFGPFSVRITNKLKEGVKKGQSLFALPVVAGTTAMTMEGDDG